jgi:hypothetical protein
LQGGQSGSKSLFERTIGGEMRELVGETNASELLTETDPNKKRANCFRVSEVSECGCVSEPTPPTCYN